jgi:hypothetical protein
MINMVTTIKTCNYHKTYDKKIVNKEFILLIPPFGSPHSNNDVIFVINTKSHVTIIFFMFFMIILLGKIKKTC